MSVLKSRVFWIAVITIILSILNQALSLWPAYTNYITLIIVALGGILAAIGGSVNAVRVMALKASNAKLSTQLKYSQPCCNKTENRI
jgi:uncharacterized membrane protein